MQRYTGTINEILEIIISIYFVFCSDVDTIWQQFLLYQTESLDVDFNELTSYAFWYKIGDSLDIHGNSKFADLVKLAKACLSLSHGNAEPERGFSENKYILQGSEALSPETIVALRAVKNFINLSEGPENIIITSTRFMLNRT